MPRDGIRGADGDPCDARHKLPRQHFLLSLDAESCPPAAGGEAAGQARGAR